MFDRTVNAKFKPAAANAGPGNNPGRRNSMLTPARGVSVGGTAGNIRKLTKVNSLTSNYHIPMTGFYSPGNNAYQPSTNTNSNSAGSNPALQRTTSESLRLNSLSRVAAAAASATTPASVSRTSSNSSLATSTSTSLAPKSTTTNSSSSGQSTPQQQPNPGSNSSSSGSSTSNTNSSATNNSKASSPNNNGARSMGGAAVAVPAPVPGPGPGPGPAPHHQPHHHHHHHHHHQHHQHHHHQQPQQTSHSQGHASSLTVGGGSGAAGGSSAGGGGANRKPKTTSSFEITSVTVGHPKLNAAGDTGDESADDLDESHTDDNSRITDLENETPSMSEDTFSKEEVYYANNALSTNAPVIPTSSQYGLVVVDPIGPSLGQTIQNVQVNVSDNIINVVSAAVTPGGTKKKDDIKETQHRSERFKVVKIESTEPFKRGRWMCMDYLDHSSVGNGGNNNEKTGSSSEAHAATDGGAAGGAEAVPQKTTQSMILPPTQKLNENHLEANSTDANWNYAEQQQQQAAQGQQQAAQQSQQQSSQQPQLSATPSGVMTAPATVVHGMHQLHIEAQAQQQQQLFDSVNANAGSPNPPGDPNNMDYARNAAMQLQQTLQQLKQREEAMDVPPGGYSGYQNGGDVLPASGSNNNNGSSSAAANPAGESQLSTSYVEQQQQPLSPAPQTPQATPTFAAVAAGQAPNFQLEQQPQATSQIDGIATQPFNPQQQQTPQRTTPHQAPPAAVPAAVASVAGATPAAAAAPPQQQTSNTSNTAVTTQGQTLPLLSHMTSYEQPPAGVGAAAVSAAVSGAGAGPGAAATGATIPTLQLQSAPATIADPQQLMVPPQQQQQQPSEEPQIPPTNIASASANNSTINLTNPSVAPGAEGSAPLTDEQAAAAATAVATAGAASATATGATAASTQQQIQQLQQQPNAESETESTAPGNRKRAFSNPHIGGPTDPSFMHRLNPQLYYYNRSQSGRSSFCVDESLWPSNARASDSNLYMGSSTEEDYEEAIDQFSPTMYTRASASRAIPIPSSAGSSPQHHPHPLPQPHPHPQHHHSQPRMAAGFVTSTAAAFSASPSIYAYPHSPFYASSPDTSLSSPVQASGVGAHPSAPSSRMSFSYDPAFQRLQVPFAGDRRPRSPLECATVFAAVAAAATSGGAAERATITLKRSVASGTSAVAIDNKIEQAMDLVKSHLMIAVREEVEVLKERISELMDKINKLELENNILKSNIPQETLQQLQMQLQIAGSQQPAAVAAPPATPAIQAPPSATAAAGQAVTAAGAGPATSPASAVAPTSIPNGSAENGGSAVSSGNGDTVTAVEQQVAPAAIVAAAAAAAAAVTAPTSNGPMS
ncbi:hypothetical protein KR026_010616 [Drosophila bipectinata]|nr:hypothetical protein KR026_010616 [Drosophila bipectinata]